MLPIMKFSRLIVLLLFLATGQALRAETERPLRSLNSNDFNMAAVQSAGEWAARREEIRNRVMLAAGLWPMPERGEVKAVMHGRVDRGDYTIDRVFFESYPGHFVTGSLYLPQPLPESMPGILCPHGHWKNGRFMDAAADTGHRAVEAQIESGAETFESAARSPLQARCVHLARMGCAVFHYDTLGNADSMQIPDHRTGARDHLKGKKPGEYGFYSTAAELRLQTNFGLQTFNSVRALDFLEKLPGVDKSRLGVTGASGGGTQTMMIAAIDDRIAAAFPCVMVSTSMQGGCTCENAPHLRIGQGNIDIAAAVAPRPLGLTAADDWTIGLETKGYPDLQSLYKLLGAEDKLTAIFATQFKHNYNQVSRKGMYAFFNKHFAMGLEDPATEGDFVYSTPVELTVWTRDHPAPSGKNTGEEHEKSMLKEWAALADASIQPLLKPVAGGELAEMRRVIGGAWRMMIGRDFGRKEDYRFDAAEQSKGGGRLRVTGLCRDLAHGEEVPLTGWYPDRWNGTLVVWLSLKGREAVEKDALPSEEVAQLLDAGAAVVCPELHLPGAERAPSVTPEAETDPNSWKASACYTYGYNPSLLARRVHDVLTVLGARQGKVVKVVAEDGAAAIGAAAVAIAGDRVGQLVVDAGGFAFEDIESIWDVNFVPGAVKYGGLRGLLSLCAPVPLTVKGANIEPLASVYAAAGAETNLRVLDGASTGDWIKILIGE